MSRGSDWKLILCGIGIVVEIYRGPNIFSGVLIYFCCLAAAAAVEELFGRYWPGRVQQSDLMVGLNNNLATQPSSLQPASNCLRIVNFATCQQFGGWDTGTPHSRRDSNNKSGILYIHIHYSYDNYLIYNYFKWFEFLFLSLYSLAVSELL